MNEENLQVILAYLDKIATKLNIGIHEIWPWFVKQQFVDAFTSLGFLLLTIIVAVIFLAITVKLWRKESKYDKCLHYYKEGEKIKKTEEQMCAYSIYHKSHESSWVWANVFFVVLILYAGLVAYHQFFDIFNPEYSAFKDIAGMLPKQ